VLALHQAICVLRYEPEKLRKITAIVCGYVDGMLGLLGTFERRHPLIAAYCKKSVLKPAAIHHGSRATLTGDEV
jgi:rhamnosyltransferase